MKPLQAPAAPVGGGPDTVGRQLHVNVLTEPPVSRSGEAAQGSEEEEEEEGNRWIHVSSVLFAQVLKGHFFQRGSVRLPFRSEWPLRGWRSAGGGWMLEERGCRAFLLLETRTASRHQLLEPAPPGWIFKIKQDNNPLENSGIN